MSAVATTETRLREVLASLLPRANAAERIGAGEALRDAGLDSFRTLELISALEAEFDIRVDEDDLRDEYFATLGGLLSLLAAKGRS